MNKVLRQRLSSRSLLLQLLLGTRLVSEFIGTFFLVLTVGLNVIGKSPAPVFRALMYHWSLCYVLLVHRIRQGIGHVSGLG